MTAAYAYAPELWLPLLGAAFETVLGLYCWRHRDVPAVRPLLYAILFTFCIALATALAAVAVDPITRIALYKVRAACILPAVTAELCFVLEYTYPGRWLTRRNLALLAVLPLLVILVLFSPNSPAIWRTVAPGPDWVVTQEAGPVGLAFLIYAAALGLTGAVALGWLFIRSPQHRWSAGLMLASQVVSSILALFYVVRQPWVLGVDVTVIMVLLSSTVYVVAVLGFRIFDPLPAARRAVLEQMHVGVVVFDAHWRVLSLNSAAEKVLGIAEHAARGRTWQQVTPPGAALLILPDAGVAVSSAHLAGLAAELPELTIERDAEARHFEPVLTELRDFRGLLMGRLLLLRDVTEQRRAQAQIVQQQRSLAVLEERERLARELHDSLGQVLAAAHLQANSARRWLQQGQNAQVDATLALLVDTTLEAEADVRDYLLGAKTMMSAERPFFPSLREYLVRFRRQYGLPVEVSVPPELEAQGLPTAVEVQLFRIIQEGLSNVRKHAQARCAQVVFSQPGGRLQVAVVDDGQGFDPEAPQGSSQAYGLQAMADRAAAIGGSLAILSQPGQGTQVVVHLPLVSLGR